MDTENIIGVMAELIKVIGWTIICMVKEFTNGLMEECTKVSITTTKSMDSVNTNILMDDLIKACGPTENKMAKAYL